MICILIVGFETKAEVICEEPTGENGYYLTAPTIVIKYQGEDVMRYRLEDANGKVISGRLDPMMKSVTIQKEVLKDGKNVLDLWKENAEGLLIDGSMESLEYYVDHTAPKNPLQFIDGEVLEIIAEDETSGIKSVIYAINDGEFQEVKGAHVYLSLPELFQGKICAYAIDRAGNRSDFSYFKKEIKKEEKNEIVIDKTEEKDNEPPCIKINGIEDFMISKEPISFQCSVNDNQSISNLKGKIIHKNENEEELEYEITEWKKKENGYEIQTELNETGIYQVHIEAEDSEGNHQAVHYQVIVDMTEPIICGLEQWNGVNLNQFQWNYKDEIVIQDLTSTTYEVRLDGILYTPGKRVEDVGRHVLEVRARDLVGNESKEKAIIQIQGIKESIMESEEEEKEEEVVLLNQQEETQEIDIAEEKVSPFAICTVSVIVFMLATITFMVIKKKSL